MMITGDENLLQIAELGDFIIDFFAKQGMGKYFKPENLSKIGRFTKLNTMLRSNKIDSVLFIDSLNKYVNDSTNTKQGVKSINTDKLHFSAMLPCGLRNPFKEYIESTFLERQGLFSDLNYFIEGNVNHELSYYPLLDSIVDADELPDIIMASDINNFFHKPFVERFIKTGVFEAYNPYTPNNYLEKAQYNDPDQNYTMYTANMLVMAVDKERLGDRKMPEKWADLLDPAFENEIIMRGEDDFFCNAVMLPFFKESGMDGIRVLAKNIKSGMHPAEMVKLAGKNNPEGAAIYILPWFFSKRIKSSKVEIVWPQDGAIASPVFLLIKKGKAKDHKDLLDLIFSKETGAVIKDRFFPSTHPEVINDNIPEKVSWLGWDFLNAYDIGKLKDDMRDEFMKIWNTKGGK